MRVNISVCVCTETLLECYSSKFVQRSPMINQYLFIFVKIIKNNKKSYFFAVDRHNIELNIKRIL